MENSPSRATTVRENMRRVEDEISRGVVHVDSYPHAIQFSPEHRCNIRCVMCYATVLIENDRVPEPWRSLQPNTLERFRKLESIVPYWNNVVLVGAGEPLLSPVLPEILRTLARYPATVAFTTHANLIDREKAELIVETGVRRLTISVDAATRETYERVRNKASWDKLLLAIDTLNTVKRERGSAHPDLCFAGNFMRQNIEELPGLIDFAADHGGAMVLATNTVIYDPTMEREALCHYPELTEAMVVAAARRARARGMRFDNQVLASAEAARILGGVDAPVGEGSVDDASVDEGSPAPKPTRQPVTESATEPIGPAPDVTSEVVAEIDASAQATSAVDPAGGVRHDRPRSAILEACQMPWKGLMVAEDGNVRNCCYTSPTIGNLNEQSFEEIWNGEAVTELRRSFLEGRPPEGCRTCNIFMSHQRDEELFVKPLTS